MKPYKQINIFGGEDELKDYSGESSYQKFKRYEHYRVSESPFKTCKNCVNRKSFEYHNKNYHKCNLIGHSSSTATDIRLRNVCDRWIETGKQ